MRPILEIRNISKKYSISHRAGSYGSLRENLINTLMFRQTKVEDFWALRDVSFEVFSGESIGIIGRNGAGKSTLLKILSKITAPASGSIVARGRVASLLEVGTGFHQELTGRENIFFNGSLLGMKRREITARFDEIVAFSGVEFFLDTPLKNYSSGMQLRLAFAVAAFLEPEILVVDEILAVGDAEFQKKCMGKMKDVTTQGRTVLFVSHNMSAIASLCKRGVLLNGGKVEMIDATDKVISRYLSNEEDAMRNDGPWILQAGLTLEKFFIRNPVMKTFDDVEYSLVLKNFERNRISDLAILIYNELNERVGIVDLRHPDLWEKSTEHVQIVINGRISQLPLVEGNYYLGFYLSTTKAKGNIMNLKRLEVKNAADGGRVPYPVRDRGHLEFRNAFEISV